MKGVWIEMMKHGKWISYGLTLMILYGAGFFLLSRGYEEIGRFVYCEIVWVLGFIGVGNLFLFLSWFRSRKKGKRDE